MMRRIVLLLVVLSMVALTSPTVAMAAHHRDTGMDAHRRGGQEPPTQDPSTQVTPRSDLQTLGPVYGAMLRGCAWSEGADPANAMSSPPLHSTWALRETTDPAPRGEEPWAPYVAGSVCAAKVSKPRRTTALPPSTVQVWVRFEGDASVELSAGVLVAPNAVLSHNHHVGNGRTAAAMVAVAICTAGGRLSLHAKPAFAFYGSTDLGGGLSLFVLDRSIADPGDVAPMGMSEDLAPGDTLQQAVCLGRAAGLYPAVLEGSAQADSITGVRYTALKVSPDVTTHGDSGSPLYRGGLVYGVNNCGDGYYAPIPDPAAIRELIAAGTAQAE